MPPQRPRLKGGVRIAPVGGAVLVSGPRVFASYTGDGARLLAALAPLLDGAHDAAALAKACDASLDDVQVALDALDADHVIEDADEADDGVDAALAPLRDALSVLTRAPGRAARRVRDARLVVLGEGRLAHEVSRVLRASGAAHVTRGVTEGAAHVILAPDAWREQDARDLNDASLASGAPWTAIRLEGTGAVVGPTVLPRETACWRCYRTRVAGARQNVDRHLALEEATRLDARAQPAFPALLVVAAALAAQAVVESVARVSHPPLAGRVALVDADTFRVERHRVLRVPRCPACSAAPVPDVDRLALDGGDA